MTEIIEGNLVRSDITQNAMGGTELMAIKMIEYIPKEFLQKFYIIHSRVRNMDAPGKKILVLHDLPGDPESDHLKNGGYNKFEKLVFVSNWQMQRYIDYYKIPWYKCVVIQNAIDPIETDFSKLDDKETIKLVYHTTPHRGLELLIPAYEKVLEYIPNLELNVYSSFKIYGWENGDDRYQELFEQCKNHEKINYYGTVSNQEIRNVLKDMHVFAYPSKWIETSCISLIESMSAGLLCVHSNLGALPETAANWTSMYQYSENQYDHLNTFTNELYRSIDMYRNNKIGNRLYNQKQYIDMFYSWELRKYQWIKMLSEI